MFLDLSMLQPLLLPSLSERQVQRVTETRKISDKPGIRKSSSSMLDAVEKVLFCIADR
jgi:hypothetical protein